MDYTYKQYEMLRAEIARYSGVENNLLTITYTAVGAFLAYIFINLDTLSVRFEMALLFTPIFVFLLAVFARSTKLSRQIQLIAAYMGVFLEPCLKGIKWETDLYKLQERTKDSHKGEWLLQSSYTSCLILLIGLFASFLYVLEWNLSFSFLAAVVCNTTLCVLCFRLVRNTRNTKLKKLYFDEWENLNKLCPECGSVAYEKQDKVDSSK